MAVQLGVKLTDSPPFMGQDSLHIKGDLSFEHVIDGTGQFVSQDGPGLAVLFLQLSQACLSFGVIPQASDGGFGKGPCEMGMANVAPRGARAFAVRLLGTLDLSAGGGKLLYPGKTVDRMDFVKQHEAKNLARFPVPFAADTGCWHPAAWRFSRG